MTEETQLPTPEPVAPTPPVSDVIPESPKKSNRTLWTILAVATTVIVCCLCIMLCMGTVGTGIWKAYTEQKPVQAVLDAYQVHPHHKEVLGQLGPLHSARHVVDYFVDKARA